MTDETSQEGLKQRITRQGEDALGKLAQDVLENPLLNSALTHALDAQKKAAQAQEVAMGALNIPSASDIERLTRRGAMHRPRAWRVGSLGAVGVPSAQVDGPSRRLLHRSSSGSNTPINARNGRVPTSQLPMTVQRCNRQNHSVACFARQPALPRTEGAGCAGGDWRRGW